MHRYLTVCLGVLLLAAWGCKEQPKAPFTNSSPPATQGAGQKACCVICIDHEMEVDSTTPTVEYKGKRYYFCSEGCKELFNKHPDKAIAVFETRKGGKPQGA